MSSVFISPDHNNTPPDLSLPLISEPKQISPTAPTIELGPLQYLVGTWTNQNLPGTHKGGRDNPYSYNVMPLPQVDPSSPTGFILKNFSYYEELTFSAIHGNAPNRGGRGTQVANTILYEQRVYFADGPNKNALIHIENGCLSYLTDSKQLLGPYGDGDGPSVGNKTIEDSTPPTQFFNLVKQVSVPHGNSILSLGNYLMDNNGIGAPVIPVVSTLPKGVDTQQYYLLNPVSNPNPVLTLNPNQALVNALEERKPIGFIHLFVDSENRGAVTNIGFEQKHANVNIYSCNYWLESFNPHNPLDFTQLQYSQTITLQIPIKDQLISFPHITANTLTKVS